MYARAGRIILGITLAVVSVASTSGAAVTVSGSLKLASPTGSTCGASATCNAAVFVCEPDTMLRDGIDTSIVNVSALGNRTGAFSFTQTPTNALLAHVRIEFYNFGCFLIEGATVTATGPRNVSIPYDAKWMIVTAAWSRDVSWTLSAA